MLAHWMGASAVEVFPGGILGFCLAGIHGWHSSGVGLGTSAEQLEYCDANGAQQPLAGSGLDAARCETLGHGGPGAGWGCKVAQVSIYKRVLEC